MRAILIALVVVGLGGCDGRPYMKLDEPVYLVVTPSFSVGCENDVVGYEACRANRILKVKNGANEWFKHFDEATTRPQVVIVDSREELPPNPVNEVVYLKVEHNSCWSEGKYHHACFYYEYGESPELRFDGPADIIPNLIAHEFGHMLGLDHDDVAEGTYSIMSPSVQTYVLPTDIDLLCEMHAECPPHKNVWCEGEFYDPCRCPSASFEEGAAMLAAGELTCQAGKDKMAGVQSLRDID